MSRNRKILIISILLYLVIFTLDVVMSAGVSDGFVYIFIVLLSILTPKNRPTIVASIISSLLIVVGYFIIEWDNNNFNASINRIIALVGVWVAAGFVIWHKRYSSDLLKKETMFRVLFESAVEAIVIVNKKGTIIKSNLVAEKLFAYEAGELNGQSVESLIPHNRRKEHVSNRQKFMTQEGSRKMAEHKDIFGVKKNGDVFPLEISLSNINVDDNQYVMAIISDLSERIKYINSLMQEKEKIQQYLDIAGTMFVIIGVDQRVKMVNRTSCEYLEYDEDEIIGKNWFDNFLPLNEIERAKEAFNQVINLKQKGFKTFENKVLTKSGNTRVILWHNTTIKEGDELIGVLSSGIDVTKQRQAENKLIELNDELENRVKVRSKALKESQEMYKLIARNFPNGVINVLDKDLNYIFAEGMEMYKLGITSETLIGTSFLDRINPEVKGEIKEQLLSVFEGKSVDFEITTEGKIYMIYAVGLHSPNSTVDQILMVSQNVTGPKMAEENMLRALDKERYLNELKSRFVSIASHEFRTPLTTTLNSLNLLSKYNGTSDKSEQQERHINRIKMSVAHLTNTLNDFLSLEKLADGKIEIHCTHFNLKKFVEEAIEDLGGLLKPNQQIIHRTHKGDNEVYLDKMMLKNIFNNLLSNSVKYSPEGSEIIIDTIIKGDLLTVHVTDQGIGIPKEEQKHLFERFFRAKNALEIQGTGLGLNIIKKYTEMVNGDVSFKSTEGEGTIFTVKLPIQDHKVENKNQIQQTTHEKDFTN